MMRSLWLLMVGALAVGCAGCGKEEAPGGNVPTASSSGAAPVQAVSRLTQDELDAVAHASKPLRLALIVKTRNNPFFDPMIRAAEEEAKELGVVLEVQAPAQETDKDRQFAIVQDMTARKVDAILIAPADSKGIVPALKQAQDKGVLVVNLDNRVDPASAQAAGVSLAAYVGADNEEGGRLAGKAMLNALPKSAKVAVLEGIRGTDNAERRKDGFVSAVQGQLDVVTMDAAEWDTQKAYAKFQSMLTARPELQGVFCANDKMALGALKAISESGKKGKLAVVGYDNIADVQPYLQRGEMRATIEQHPDLMGKYGVRAAVGILNGSIQKGREFLVPLEVKTGK